MSLYLAREEIDSYFSKLEKQGVMLGLSRIKRFLELLGNPHLSYKTIHVAGTNGKGSTSAMLARILQLNGYRVGLYTSPHLIEFNERIQVNGVKISNRALGRFVAELKALKDESQVKLSYFEFTTALAFKYFAENRVDFAVIEVGLGGRLDATNVLNPTATAITNVSLEHEGFLGDSLSKIAFEKAGIVKQGIPLFTAERKQSVLRVLRQVCMAKKSKLFRISKPFEGKIGLRGEFQKLNAALAAAIATHLGVDNAVIEEGLSSVEWPGRFEIVQGNPPIVLDCAHNPAGILAFRKALEKEFQGQKFCVVFGASSDKNVKGMLRAISPTTSSFIVTEARVRAMPASVLELAAKAMGKPCIKVKGVSNALEKAMACSDRVLVCGSCFVVGEAKTFLQK